MKRINAPYIILSWLVLFLTGGCSRITGEEPAPGEAVMVNLDVSVFLTDVSSAVMRASKGYEAAVSDDEKMQKLRIVIVRPDGTVEHNRLVNLQGAAVETHKDEKFVVVANEAKQIYLFVNEGLTEIRNKVPVDAVSQDLEVYDFGSLTQGSVFPAEKLAALTIGLGGTTQELAGPLPMSECHRVWVPKEGYTCDLFVTRAAVKFSFRITNASGHPLTLERLTIDKMLHKEYYLPNNTVYGLPNADGGREITSFEVPSTGENNGYYTFEKTFGGNGVNIAANEERVLDAIYLLEGKYADPAAGSSENIPLNYSMNISLGELDGKPQQNEYFTNLPQLPRNTHVVVNITIKGQSEIIWTVDVVPYGEVILKPDFGLD